MSSRKVTRSIIVGVAAIAVAGGSYGIVSATSSSSPAAASTSTSRAPLAVPHPAAEDPTPGPGRPRGISGHGQQPVRVGIHPDDISGPEGDRQGGVLHDLPEGDQPGLSERHHHRRARPGPGTTSSTTITAAQVTVEPAGNPYTATSAAVVPFQKGAPGTSKTIGQIPADYTQGSGTIVSGTAATKATEAALAAYPGGVVDRVVQLGNGDYEVHTIGVNWPHHIFVNQDFQVIGAND